MAYLAEIVTISLKVLFSKDVLFVYAFKSFWKSHDLWVFKLLKHNCLFRPPEKNVALNQYNTLLFSVLPSAFPNHLDGMIQIHILASYA